jgi:hypothetical protein
MIKPIWLLLLVTSCHNSVSHQINSEIRSCGPFKGRPIPVHSVQGNPVLGHVTDQLEASLITAQTRTPIPITAQGCLDIPNDTQGTVVLLNPEQRQLWSWPVNTTDWPVEARLQAWDPPEQSWQCPHQGWYSTGTMNLPLNLAQGPAMVASTIALQVHRADDLALIQETILKPQGLALTPDTKLPVEVAQEGDYLLTPILIDPFRQRQSLAPACRLRVLKQAPQLEFVDWPESEAVFASDETLPVAVRGEGSVRYCVAPKGEPDVCRQDDAFQTLEGDLKIEDTGHWQVYLYAQDPAGNRSETSVKTVTIDNGPPQLQLQWAHEPQDAVIFDALPRRIYRTSSTVSDDTAPTEVLEKNLECQVNYSKGNGSVIQGHFARCLNGRCRGADLATWKPCPADLQFVIDDRFRDSLTDGLLQVEMRTYDAKGRTGYRALQAFTGPPKNLDWQRVPNTQGESDQPRIYDSSRLAQGAILLATKQGLWIWDQAELKPLALDDVAVKKLEQIDDTLFALGSENIWQAATNRPADWQLVGKKPADLGRYDDLTALRPDPRSGIWYLSSNDMVYRQTQGEDNWELLPCDWSQFEADAGDQLAIQELQWIGDTLRIHSELGIVDFSPANGECHPQWYPEYPAFSFPSRQRRIYRDQANAVWAMSPLTWTKWLADGSSQQGSFSRHPRNYESFKNAAYQLGPDRFLWLGGDHLDYQQDSHNQFRLSGNFLGITEANPQNPFFLDLWVTDGELVLVGQRQLWIQRGFAGPLLAGPPLMDKIRHFRTPEPNVLEMVGSGRLGYLRVGNLGTTKAGMLTNLPLDVISARARHPRSGDLWIWGRTYWDRENYRQPYLYRQTPNGFENVTALTQRLPDMGLGDGLITMAFDHSNRLWLGSDQKGLFMWDGQTLRSDLLSGFPIVRRIFASKQDGVWLLAYPRLSRLDYRATILRVPPGNQQPHIIAPSDQLWHSIFDLVQDHNGQFWALGITSTGPAVGRWQADTKQWQEIPLPPIMDRTNPGLVLGVSSRGQLWVAGQKRHLAFWQGTTWRSVETPFWGQISNPDIGSDEHFAVAPVVVGDALWLGGQYRKNGLGIYDPTQPRHWWTEISQP